MGSAKFIVGDVREVMADMPSHSIDAVITSPPFFKLRKYGADAKEIGAEATPHEYLDTMLGLSAEWRRLLAPHGSIAIELGDTYAGTGGGGGDKRRYSPSTEDDAHRADNAAHARGKGFVGKAGMPLAKSLCGIPTLYPWCLAYGRNLLTAEESPAGQWRVRNLVVWARPNPTVGELTDKVRPATSYITMACVGPKRFFDLESVRVIANGQDRPPYDYWLDGDPDDPTSDITIEIAAYGYEGAHFATWPPALANRLVSMLVPERVCEECGKPSERIIERTRVMRGKINPEHQKARSAVRGAGAFAASALVTRKTVGWSDCGHGAWRRGVVLDPFGGSGTTLSVATGLGRDAIGIELYDSNRDLARDRIGLFMEDW